MQAALYLPKTAHTLLSKALIGKAMVENVLKKLRYSYIK